MAGLVLAVACRSSPPTPPAPTEWLTDTQKVFTSAERYSLNVKLEAYHERSKHYLLVWVGDSTHKEAYNEYALRAFNSWAIGRERYDDGVVLFVWVEDDMRWLTVGYGLERAIPDREAVRICRDVIRPMMHQGKTVEGINLGVDLIIAAIDKSEVNP